MITEHTRGCSSCRRVLPPPPAAPVCETCGTVNVIDHREWDPRVKYFAAAAYLSRHAFLSWDSEQAAWEKIIRTLIGGAGGGHASPFGVQFDEPVVQCYPIITQLSIHWRANAAPITHNLLETIGRSAGLIAESFPRRKAS